MKKVTSLTLLVFLSFAVLTGCVPPKVNPVQEDSKGMIHAIQYDQQTKALSFSITNTVRSTITFGLAFTIEKSQIGNNKKEWVLTDLTDDLVFIEIAVVVEPGQSHLDAISLSILKKPFTQGNYRIVRVYTAESTNITAYIEFDVNERKELSGFRAYNTLYNNLSGFKGLELYAWSDTTSSELLCGLLEGTNRNKNADDFQYVMDNPVSVRRMAEILGEFKQDTFVMVNGIGQPLTSEMITQLKTEFDQLEMPNLSYQK